MLYDLLVLVQMSRRTSAGGSPMNMEADEKVAPRARYGGGEVKYPDAASMRADLENFLRHGLLWVAGDSFPAALEEFVFDLVLPNSKRLSYRGQVIARPGPGRAMVRISNWTEQSCVPIEAALGSAHTGADGRANAAPAQAR